MHTTLTPCLSFPGTTREAFTFYAGALGAEIQTMLNFADMPAPPGPPPGRPYEGIEGHMLALQYATVDDARRVFAALSEGGTVTMPLMPSFWTKIFGMVTDRFGVNWAVNGEPIPMG